MHYHQGGLSTHSSTLDVFSYQFIGSPLPKNKPTKFPPFEKEKKMVFSLLLIAYHDFIFS
jgi:hypothetical protein